MTPKPTGWDELHLAENPAVELLQPLGYTYIPPENLEPERASPKETVLTSRLAAALKRLNRWLSETNVAKAGEGGDPGPRGQPRGTTIAAPSA